jgi:3-methyladenine DNA glycosylase AlkD
MTASTIMKRLRAVATPEKAAVLARFFKTGPGQYGEGDRFLGVMVPEQRKLAKEFRDLPLPEVETLLASPYHEARLTGFLVLTCAFERADESRRREFYEFTLVHRAALNNWDLVDVIAPVIIGGWLLERPADRKLLRKYAKSTDLWERRIAIVATLAFIRAGDFGDTLAISEVLLGDKHDLIHKATGWMLREVGKRDVAVLRGFLGEHAARMPRTALRYAIERLPEAERKAWLAVPRAAQPRAAHRKTRPTPRP